MPTAKQRWYPGTHELKAEDGLLRVVRRLLDMLYEQNEQLGPSTLFARANESMTIGENTWTSISRCLVTFPRAGKWSVMGFFTITVQDAADLDKLFQGALFSRGRQEAKAKLKVQSQPTTVTISQAWELTVENNQTAVLQVHKETGATGTSILDGANTVIIALWEGRQNA